jgi:MFS family permease
MERRIFNVLFISILTTMVGLGIIAPLMPIYAQNLGATGIWLGIIFSGFSLARVIFMPLIGRISDQRGRKFFITLGLFLYSIISLIYPLAQSVYQLSFIRVMHGCASAMVLPIAMAYVGDIAHKGEEGKIMGTFNMALFLGIGSGPFLGGLLNDTFGLGAAFYAMAFLTTIAFLITLIFLPDLRIHIRQKTTPSWRSILKNNVIKGLFIFRMANAIKRGSIMVFLPLFAARIHISPSEVGILLSANIFLTGLLQRPFGKLADRWNKFWMVLMGSLISALGLILVPFTHNFTELFVTGILVGIGGAIAMPAATAIAVLVGQATGMGTSMGIFNTAMSLGMVFSPILLGTIMDAFGLPFIFYFAGLVGLLSCLVFYYYTIKGK